ncbi:hypothetical protein [Jeotgalibaca caeni]|uniref:hypothetical protein n=1 Tax=Jeotgalibaca caeni TaxID=3028623 RepID=UPI00237EDA4F|nr:hypothetical protein [Jeotgalibaca caeni]MDE1549618.1 hypothetical protein [Jeotgalibaca caeni]
MNLVNSNRDAELVKIEDVTELLRFVLMNEKRVYKENPFQSTRDKAEKEREYLTKIDKLALEIAEREGINYED